MICSLHIRDLIETPTQYAPSSAACLNNIQSQMSIALACFVAKTETKASGLRQNFGLEFRDFNISAFDAYLRCTKVSVDLYSALS